MTDDCIAALESQTVEGCSGEMTFQPENGQKEPVLGQAGEEHSREREAKCKGWQAGASVCVVTVQ